MFKKLSITLLLFCTFGVQAQVPDTDLHLFKIEKTKGGLKLQKPVNITNRPGYDNQASLTPDSKKILYTSIREDGQADVYVYDLKKKKSLVLTKTPISEYSPVLSADGKFVTSVVVESDSSQYLHFINPVNGLHDNKMNVDSVGYYTFLNQDTVIYYKLTDPHSLRYHSLKSGEDKWLAHSPTRAFKAISRNTLLYGIKDSSKVIFYKYYFLLHKAEKFCEYPSLNEDFIWHPVLGLIKSEDLKLMYYDSTLKEWKLLFDLSGYGLKKITRFDIDPKTNFLVVTDNL